MSMSKILFVKGINSESDGGSQIEEDIWDDAQLNNAYDKALKMANVEVAKRIAMSTNSKVEKDSQKSKSSKAKNKNGKKPQWSVGSACRAIYEEDGNEYEAFILKLVNDNECVVRFLGYDNSEIVAIDSLQPSQGKQMQQEQIEKALLDQGECASSSQPTSDMEMSNTNRVSGLTSPTSTDRSAQKKNKSKKKKNTKFANEPTILNGFHLPGSLPTPDMEKLRNLGSMDMPMAPPPLPFPTERVECEDQAISSMLLSWYMSGYYTGLYQGLKRSKQSRNQRK